MPRQLLAVTAATIAVAAATAVPRPAPARAAACPAVTVPGAERQVTACLDDLTTAGTVASGHTVPADWAGLQPAGARNPRGVPGRQIDGYFPDTSTTNTNNGWDHDAQFVIRQEFDPAFSAPVEAGTPYCASGTPGCDADYDYASRPRSVHRAVRRVALTGRIGRPLITLHGTLDTLLPIARDSDVYDRLIRARGRGGLHRYYRIEGGNHVDGLYDAHPELLRPILPCFHTAFTALEDWAGHGTTPPPSATVPRPATGDPANICALT